jgi:CheY-like chemotaxis protein
MNALQVDNCYLSLLHEKKMIRKKILIVDDEEHLRELVQACLEDLAGWDTLVAASGKECLEILQTEKPNAILLDVSMPGMDGLVVYEILQSNPITRSIPVILLTARVLPRDRAKFAQMGLAGVITKPFQPATLTEEVAEILGWED